MLEIRGLTKRFGDFVALDGLDMTICDGDLYGFVGPNGAGKTTTMRIISGLLSADAGSVMVDGQDALANPDALKRQIGYMPDFFGIYNNLTVMEYLDFFASIYGIVGEDADNRCRELLTMTRLTDKAYDYVDDLSRGMKQRLCLARCLIHDPKLLILDEPASGLDPRARFDMKEILSTLHEYGKTIVVSSHILPEISEMCDKIAVIEKGRIVMDGTIESINEKMHHQNPIMMTILGDSTDRAIKFLKEDKDVISISMASDNEFYINYRGDEKQEAILLSKLIAGGVHVSSFARRTSDLESVFLEITRE